MRKFYQMIFGVLVLPALLLSGCTGGTDGKTVETDPGAEAVSSPPVQEETPSEEESSAIFVTFEGTDLEGNTVSEDVFTQSKLTMVNVWATYCNPCLREMPGLGELAAEYDGSEFQIIGIVSDVREGEDQALVESLVQQTGANYPHLLLNDSINNAFMGSVSGVPTTFFFDGEGMYLGGVVGSWLVGVIDEKIGTKKTMIGFGVWYCIALLLNFATGMTITPLVYVSLFMIAMGIGGSANFTTSLPTSIFGRQGFDKVNAVIFPIQGAITALCFAVNGIVQLITGGQIRMAYIVFAGVALVNVVLVLLIDEHKYNRDWKAAHKAAK